MNEGFKNLSDELFWQSYNNRVPLYSLLEVTSRCNFDCIHCYIPQEVRRKNDELSTKEIMSCLEEIKTLGGLYIVFTGGEPLLREDIFTLLEVAKKLNFVVILFTNGSLINKETVSKIISCGVDKVEISLYGNKHFHEKFVRRKDVFSQIVSGIKMLKHNNIDVCIKSVLTKYNWNQKKFLENFAYSLGVRYKFDIICTPRNNGDIIPTTFIVEEKKLVKLLKQYNLTQVDIKKDFTTHILCSAGRNIVAVSSRGEVYPCIQFPYFLGSIKKEKFVKIWRRSFSIVEKLEETKQYQQCLNCDILQYCRRCPGISFIQTRTLYGCDTVAKLLACVTRKTVEKTAV